MATVSGRDRVEGLHACGDVIINMTWEVKDGWERLYRFLGAAVPDVPFPHLNDREAFQMLLRQAQEYGTP
jgi:Sulfotransferase domain